MNIKGIDKVKLLIALYNAAKVPGLGLIHYIPIPMDEREAEIVLLQSSDMYFDYLNGRVMKVDISGDYLNTRLYNRDNGEGAAEKAICDLIQQRGTTT